jgi:uncharacterized coiled-coil DUF342 family protein
MDANQLKQEALAGRVSVETLVDWVVRFHEQLQASHQQLREAQRRIEELEKKGGGSGTAKLDQPFSVKAEEKRQEARGQKKRPKPPKGPCR